MSILVTGGRGKTSIRLAALLDRAKLPFILASRSKSTSCHYPQLTFDWFDQGNWDSILKEANPPFQVVYLVPPQVMNPERAMKAFIEKCREHGVKRFVMLSAAAIEAGGPAYGVVHQYLVDSGLDYAVLRPTWFMENLSEQQHLPSIKTESQIYSATQSGKIPWVSAADIAAVAFRSIVDEIPHNSDHIILGPELLTYDEVAQILSEVLGRRISHVKLTVEEMSERFQSLGMPEEYAQMLSGMDGNIAQGSEDRMNGEVEKVTGHPPIDLRTWAEKNRNAWI